MADCVSGCNTSGGCAECLEALPCGHYLCGACSCRMDSPTVMSLMCEECELEDSDISCLDGLSIQSEIPLDLSANVDSSMAVDEDSGSMMKQVLNESNDICVMDAENPVSGDSKDNLYLKIDEALIVANSTLHHLNSTFQTLKVLDTKNKALERRISKSVHDSFGRLISALKKRKSELLNDLKAVSEVFEVELQDAAKNIEKQIQCLETRVAFAKGLKQSPLVSVYCDLNQLIADLKMSFQNEDLLEPLKNNPDIRFTIDIKTILKACENLGRIDSTNSAECQSTPNLNVAFEESHALDVNPEPRKKTRMKRTEYTKGFIYEPCEPDFDYMNRFEHKMDTSSHQESRSISSPDVIIEEIIEENQFCLLEDQNNNLDYTKEKPWKMDLSWSKPKSHNHLRKDEARSFGQISNQEFGDVKTKKFKKNQQRLLGTSTTSCRKKTPPEHVYLSHIINPCNFYVHSYTQKRQLIMLERTLTTLSQTCKWCSPKDVLELGEIIAFQSVTHNKWCRGNVLELIPLESKCVLEPRGPTRYKIEDLTHLTLFLLDYGGAETFVAARFAGSFLNYSDPMTAYQTKVHDLHKILIKLSSADEESITLMPPFAIQCSLDIVPQRPDGSWTKDIIDHILKLVGNKCVSMKVFREEHNKLIVDLKKPFDSKIKSAMPLSLREALVLSELAKFPSNVSMELAYYKEPILPENIVEVVVCHINDPSDFYIHVVGDTDYRTTEDKIQEVYGIKGAEDWQITCPVVGQPCVARFTEDDHWYRAEIMALPTPQEAVIKYADFGNITKVNVADLRSLKKEFMTLPRKAISCRLAYIQPFNAESWWSSDACLLFQSLTSYRRLRCTSIGVLLEKKLSVELYDEDPSKTTSINTILVQENVASFILCTSDSANCLPLKEVWDPVMEVSPASAEITMDNFSLFERKELDVFISHVVSPSKIYVQWLTTQNILKSMEANMFDQYENSKPEAIEWQIDMQVAVQLHSDKKWKRARVTRIISDSLVEVFCYDFGMQKVINVTSLRTLDENYHVYGAMCLECSLMDIQPAGGTENWTATACDLLSHYLCGATTTMIIEVSAVKDNASQWPLPVRILSKNEADQLVDVSEFLVTRGLALRERIKKCDFKSEANDKGTERSAKSCLQEDVPVEVPVNEVNPECEKTVTSEQSDITEPVMEPIIAEQYLPRLLPDEKTFLAKVSHVDENGTIHIIHECLEMDLNMLMVDIQNSFKSLGLMQPYSWTKGEGCLIKGSDTMSYRGKVLDLMGGDMITVQYEDYGYTEKLPKCHLYPSLYNPHIPRFCIPCQLNDILPVGDHWQPDTIQLLKELLLERLATVHAVEPPKSSHGIASILIYIGSTSVSAILEQYGHGIRTGCEKNILTIETDFTTVSHEKIWPLQIQELLEKNLDTPLLPKYTSVSLPRTGELIKVEVTHIQTPNVVFLCIRNENRKSQIADFGDGDCDPVRSILNEIASDGNKLFPLTDFTTDMPCLARYSDGLLCRAKLQSIKSYDPVNCVVEYVDYGCTEALDNDRLFQIPASLTEYPAKAIKVKLAGFKPPKEDFDSQRLVYCPEWSMKSLYAMMDLLQKNTFFASCVAGSENTVLLYDDHQQLVHMQLIKMGLAEMEEI